MKNTQVAVMLTLAVALSVCARSAAAQIDPCTMLTLAEVQRIFPGSSPGVLERDLEKYGILRCAWRSPAGRLLLIASREPDETAKEEVMTWVEAMIDPLRPGEKRRVRIDAVPGIPDQALAVVEREDRPNALMHDAAFIVVQRGTWQVSLMAPDLARRERPDAIRALAELGRAVAARLK